MNLNPLARTQRAVIREHNEQSNIEERQTGIHPDDVPVEIRDKSEPKEKRVYFLPKCLLLVITVLALLAGVIVLIIFFKEKGSQQGPRGHINPDEIPEEECPDVSVILRGDIVISCNFKEQITGKVEAIHENLVGATTKDFDCTKSDANLGVNCKANEKAKCSSRGNILVRFYEADDKKVQLIKRVKVNIIVQDNSTNATISQVYNGNISQSEFHLECKHEKDCTSYELRFFGNGKNLADTKTCTSTYSDEHGYTIACKATVSSKIILEHANQSKLYCQLMQGTTMKKKKELALPSCDDNSTRSMDCNASTTNLFNCTDTSPVLENCTKQCLEAKECFLERDQELPNSSISCPCALKWCRRNDEYGSIDDTGRLSFNDMCPD